MVNRSPAAVITGTNRYLSAVTVGNGPRLRTAAAVHFYLWARKEKRYFLGLFPCGGASPDFSLLEILPRGS